MGPKLELYEEGDDWAFAWLAADDNREEMVELESDAEGLVKVLLLRAARMLSRNWGRPSWIKGSGAGVEVDVMDGDAV